MTLVDTIIPLWDDPGSVEDPWKELQRIVLCSYSLSEHQKIIKWLDHPGLGADKSSVLMDQLTALQPSSIVEVQKILFLRKMPTYIRDMINLKDFQNLPALKDRSPTPALGGSGDGYCFYHARFGSRAKKCKNGCTYQENE